MRNLEKTNIQLTGNITPTIISLSLPLMLNNLIRTLYNLTDGLYVARLSSEDFAATAFVWPLNFLFISLGMGLGVASTSMVSQALGANQIERAKKVSQNALNLSLILGFVLALIGYLMAGNFVEWMGASGLFAQKASTYLAINFIGLFFDFIYFPYQAILNADGQTKKITLISSLSSLINLVLDPIFIFDRIGPIPGLGLGIAGAAWATVLSKIVLVFLGQKVVKLSTPIDLKLLNPTRDWRAYQTLVQIAVPASLGYGGAALGFTVMNGLIQSYGTDTLAAYSMGNRITDLMTQPQMGIGMALTSLVGQNIGAGQYQRAKAIIKKTIELVLLISLFASILIIVFRDPLIGIFIKDGSNVTLINHSREYMIYSAFIIFFMGLFSVYNGAFQGMGKTRYSMIMAVGRLWVFRLPFIWIFANFTMLESTGIWIAMLLSNALTVTLAAIFYRRIDWTRLRRLSS
ncbi:TPA: MATE family efflux transporter [Streptococcus suis]